MHSDLGAAGYTKHEGGSTAGRKCPSYPLDLHSPDRLYHNAYKINDWTSQLLSTGTRNSSSVRWY